MRKGSKMIQGTLPVEAGISFDLDGVVFQDQGPEFIQFLKEDCKLPFDDAEFSVSHSWSTALAKPVSEVNDLFARFAVQGPTPQFAPGAKDGLFYISRFAQVYINTARHGDALKIALSELEKARIVWTAAYGGMSRKKSDPLRQHGIPIHVEDSAEDIRLVVEQYEHARVVQFPSYAPGSVVTPIIHDRVHVLPSLHQAFNLSQEVVIGRCWKELVEHVEALWP